jgi:hypothetical protein
MYDIERLLSARCVQFAVLAAIRHASRAAAIGVGPAPRKFAPPAGVCQELTG